MLRPGNQKIAICFSGQLRTWKQCKDTWHNVLVNHGSSENVDVFCHIWDYNTKPNSVDKTSLIEKINSSEIEELISFLKPKKFLVESFKYFKPFKDTQPITFSPFLSQYYGILRAARLKKEYEIENNLMYDAVARMRYDSYVVNNIAASYVHVKPNVMHGFHFGWDLATNRGRMGDIFWFANSETYDIIADYYLNIHTINPKYLKAQDDTFTPEFVFFHYIKKSNILIQNNHWDIKLFRRSAEESFSKDKTGYETW